MSERLLPVAILAGGLTTRLRPLTDSIPKALIEIRGEPFIAHQLRLLRRNGIGRVVICAAYRAEMIQDFVGGGDRYGLTVDYSLDGATLRGTGGAIHHALPLLGDSFFVLYGDSYLPCEYAAIEHAFHTSAYPALMTVYRNEDRGDASNVEFSQGRILNYDKKDRTPRMRHLDYGLGIFRSSVFAAIAPGTTCDLVRIYQDVLARNELAALEVFERFYEIGSREGIQALTGYLAAREEGRLSPQ